VGLLFLAFAVVPFVELYLLIRIGRVIGAPSTLAFVIAMGALGAALAKQQGARVVRQWREALGRGEAPAEGVLEGALVLLGGILLITPGVITDFFGLWLLVPWTRRVLAGRLRTYLQRQIASGRIQVHTAGMGFSPGASSAAPTQVGHGPGHSGQVVDTEGEEVR
jgi:UPF0716 protein FxsA